MDSLRTLSLEVNRLLWCPGLSPLSDPIQVDSLRALSLGENRLLWCPGLSPLSDPIQVDSLRVYLGRNQFFDGY